ncbi:hypothetical protein KP509_22G055300 [Ceratopteris richardii]|uniref:Reticulon-like protein n=1 Tax=Ceratopteris richardii TaxID=49495 RepID=A0A8T2S6D4_CERRI|nr:hypothetical protein KP509_22G055300 [Ceratopteris richardii]
MEVERKSMEDTEKGTPDGERNITSETLDSMLQKFENGDAPDVERKDAVNEEQDLPAEESAICLDKVEVDQKGMAEQEEDSSGGERSIDSDTLDSTVGKIKQLPAAQSAQKVEKMSRETRLFGREKSVYELLGSGRVADVLLWRNAMLSAGILTSITTIYVAFEWLGWHVLSVFSRLLIIALAVLFVWSNMASLLKKYVSPTYTDL